MSEKKRRRWAANEKLRIVLTCLQPEVEVSEVYRKRPAEHVLLAVVSWIRLTNDSKEVRHG